MRLFLGVSAISLVVTGLPAQSPQPAPPIRRGFWMSGGYGVSGVAWQCDVCAKQDDRGGSLFLGFGGTPSKQVLLGLEVSASFLDVGTPEIRSSYATFTGYWYPKVENGLFLKGGVGAGTFWRHTSTSDERSHGGAFMVGAGYDIRVARRISIAPVLTFWSTARANITDDSTTLDTGLRQTGLAFQVGARFDSPLGARKSPPDRSHIRKGLWGSIGFGGGNVAWRCDGCSNQNHGAGSAVLRVGWTLSQKVLLGAELNGLGPYAFLFEQFGRDSLNEIRATLSAATVHWYPKTAGGLFLKGGVGVSSYSQVKESVEASSDAGAMLVGVGFDHRLTPTTSFTTMLTLWGSTKADLKDGSTTIANGLRHTGVTLQIGITGH